MARKHTYVTVSTRIDEDVKKEAARVLKEFGLTPAMAFRIMMRRIIAEDAVPFELLPSNSGGSNDRGVPGRLSKT